VVVERFPVFSDVPAVARLGQEILAALTESRPFTWLTTLPPGLTHHLVVPPEGVPIGDAVPFGPSAVERARIAYEQRFAGLSDTSDPEFFIHSVPPRSRLLIVGATDIATHLVRLAAGLDFETVVIDPREAFASKDRFSPAPDRIITRWPQEVLPELDIDDETYVVLLTHDPKLDDPALHVLLESPVAYIGALGSRRTHGRRLERLAAAGFDSKAAARVIGPVGLDIGASSPAEIALSIISQVVTARNRVVSD
ncbi:MAG: XdhC family protein, partial [Rhodothermales bacterium]|nr:XdhC family protein [Rhodothermales bacterium]